MYCILLYCTALHCTALHCTALHCTALHCTALHCTALHCTALHCIALNCTALHRTVLHCTALHLLHCTVIHRTVHSGGLTHERMASDKKHVNTGLWLHPTHQVKYSAVLVHCSASLGLGLLGVQCNSKAMQCTTIYWGVVECTKCSAQL